jgi:hypothetical protein
LYNGMLVLGYATVFTSFPVISLVLDEDVTRLADRPLPPQSPTAPLAPLHSVVRLCISDGTRSSHTAPPQVSETNALKFPELYRELQKRRYLSMKTFLLWAWKA